MDDNNKLPKQAKPQAFELVELLFQEYIRSNIARPNIEYSFQARFQSFINQIPSYLHSSNKIGFFTHFFFGSFATLLDTNLGEKLGIKKLQYSFNTIDNLRIVAETDDKTHIFIFTENSSKNNKKQKQDKNKELAFTKGEWQQLKGRVYTDDDNDNLEISVIKINKSKGAIKITVEKQDIKDGGDSTKQYHDITKQCVDQNGHYVYLEDQVSLLSDADIRKMGVPLQDMLKHIKKIHDHYQNIPYGDSAQEADQHGFVAGIFNNFRYRENAHVYLEQFAGRGYADIVLLVRGADRATKSIPIIIELKAGTSIGTTAKEALKQVLDYTQGFQPNNMRILSLADNILCVGMNLDHNVNSFIQMQLVQRQSKVIPVIQSIITRIIENDFANQNLKKDDLIAIQNQIKGLLENTYQTFPGTGEKSSAHYYSRFIIGQSLLLQDYDKHIFVYDSDEYIATKTVIDQHSTRLKDGSTIKKKKIEKIVDDSNAVTSVLLLSKDQDEPAIILNIIDANREIELKNIPLDNALIGNRKVLKLNIKFNINKSNKSFKEYCDIELSQVYNSALEYNNANNIQAKGDLKKISFKTSIELSAQIKNAIDSQQGLIISESKYKELFAKIGEVIYPVKSLINSESEFQGILEGIFKYYSDLKLSQQPDRRELVLTEFQTGGGSRIDMIIQAIGELHQGAKEYIPIGLELKYDDSVKLNSFDKRQDEYIQGLILAHKEQVLVKELLADQTERYSQGAAIKTITDGNKVAIMGIIFNKQAQDHNSLLLTTEKLVEAHIVHSSKLYTTSVNIDVASINDLPPPDAEYFIPDWIERETLDLIGKAEADDDSNIWSLSNSLLDDQKMQELQHLLQKDKQLAQYIDGLDLSFNSVTANSIKELIKQLRRLVYLDLSDNDLANNNLLDLEKIIEDIQVPILKIADIGMNDVQMGKIFQSFAKYDRIENLDIEHLEDDDNNLVMSQDTADKISKYLRSTRTLNHLSLAGNKIGDQALSIIAEGLRAQETLNSLVLTENKIGSQGAKALGVILKDTAISRLDLSGNPLKVLGVKAIVDNLNKAKNINSIELVNVNLHLHYNIDDDNPGSEELLTIINDLFKNPHLTNINIAHNDIGNGALRKIFEILSKEPNKSNLQDLSLAGNKIDWGAHPINTETLKLLIYDFLSQSQKIRSLDLALMEIDDDIGKIIADALEKNRSLINLDLGGNDIGRGTVNHLLGILKTHQYLTYLNLSDNKLDIVDLQLIIGALKTNQVLSHINLSGNDFSGIINDHNGTQYLDRDNQGINFVPILESNTVLKYLNMANCNLNKQTILSLFKAMEDNISIEVLDIRDNKIESSIVDNILESLEKNANQGLDIGLKVLHISKGDLNDSAVSKLKAKGLGILVSIEGDVSASPSLEERLQTCGIDPVDKKGVLELDREHQTFESETLKGHYHYWLQAHDMADIARVYYDYNNRDIAIIGSIGQLSTQITRYLTNNNNARPLTIILNIGEDGAGGNHWVSLVLNRVGSNNYGYYIDSIGEHINSNTASILSQHGILIRDLSTKQQTDGYNCGLWALENSRRICEILEANRDISNEHIRNSLVISRSEEAFEEIRDNILRELLSDDQRRINLDNIGITQVEMPADYNDNYALYSQAQGLYEQCAISAAMAIGSSFKITKSKRSITEINNQSKPLLASKKFVDCANDIKQDVVYSQLMTLINHFKVVGDHKSCKAIDKLIKNQGIINKLKSIKKTIPIAIINVKDSGYNWSPLHCAAQFGDVEEVEKLIMQGMDVNIKARDGWTALHLASQYANQEIVRVLISYNASTDIPAKRGWTPLHLASQSISTEIIELLIKNGAYVDAQTYHGWAPLHIAVPFFNQEIVGALLKNKANINIINQIGWTALHLAVLSNNVGMVKLLMENSADITVIDQDHNTPLHLALKHNYKDIIKYLIEEFRGENSYTLLHLAIIKSTNKEIIDLLIKHGANVDVIDKYGNTPLHLAVAMNNKELVKYLIEHKANVNAVGENGNTPLHLAVAINNRELTEYLIEHNANVNVSNDSGDSPLSIGTKIAVGIGGTVGVLSVIGGTVSITQDGIGSLISTRGVRYSALSGSNHEIFESLVEHGASLNTHNIMGNTPLHESVQNNNYEMAEFWINKGADVDATNNVGNTPLHIATSNLRYRGRITRDIKNNNAQSNTDDSKAEQIIHILVQHQANVNIQNKENDTPLHLAVNKRNKDIIALFLKEVKDGSILFSIQNNNGQTVLNLAFASNNSDIISCFTNFRDNTGSSILHLAILKNNKQILLLLIQNKADVNIVNHDGNTPLYLAVKSNNKDVIDILIKNGANINTVDKSGDTPLHLAVAMSNEELVKYLIEHNANLNMRNNDGNTPLHLAMNLRHQEIMKYLIQHGANVIIKNKLGEFALQDIFVLKMFKNAVDNNGNSMLHNAVRDHDENMVLLLLQEKVNVDIQNKEGNTALHLAAMAHDIKMFELLLQSRADTNIKNMAGKTPIELGIKNDLEVHQLLYKYRIPVFTEQKDLSHKHRHHHGENYHREEHHNKNIAGHYRGRRDVEDKLEKIDSNNSDGNILDLHDDAISTSSVSSSLKPIGYNMINWLRDNIWKSINLNPLYRIKILLNVDDVKKKVNISNIDVSDNVGYASNKNQQDDLVKKLSIIRSIKAQIAALEESKIAETKLLKALNQKLNVVGQDYQYKYDKQKEYEEELSNRLLTLQIRKVDIQKQDAEISKIAIIKEINNEIEKIKQAIQENEQLNSDYFHAIATVKEMALHGDITELFYEDCIRYLGQKIKDCEEEDTRLVYTLQELEKQLKTPQEVYYTDNTLESIVEEKSLRKIAALNTQEKKILQEEEELASTYSSNQYQELKADQLKDQIKLQESKIESVNKRLDELYDNLATLDTSYSNLAGHEDLSYLHETIDAQNDTAYQVSRWVNNSINLTNLSNGFIGNNTYQDQVFDYSALDFQGNLLLLNLLMPQKNGVKYNHDNKTIITNDLNSEYAQNLAYSSYASNAEENKDNIGLLGTNDT